MTTTSCPWVVSAMIASRVALTSSPNDTEGLPAVVGRDMGMHLCCCASKSEVILFHVSVVCHAPGTKTRVGLLDMMNRM